MSGFVSLHYVDFNHGSFFDCGFVDEHHGNVVADWINALALDAFQRAAVRFELDVCLASRTSEYFQKFLIYCHGMTFLSGTIAGMPKAYHNHVTQI